MALVDDMYHDRPTKKLYSCVLDCTEIRSSAMSARTGAWMPSYVSQAIVRRDWPKQRAAPDQLWPVGLDGTGKQEIVGNPAMNPWWEITPKAVSKCLEATEWRASVTEYFLVYRFLDLRRDANCDVAQLGAAAWADPADSRKP